MAQDQYIPRWQEIVKQPRFRVTLDLHLGGSRYRLLASDLTDGYVNAYLKVNDVLAAFLLPAFRDEDFSPRSPLHPAARPVIFAAFPQQFTFCAHLIPLATAMTPELDPTTKTRVLLEALPYIQRFRGSIFVVKFGGAFMARPRPDRAPQWCGGPGVSRCCCLFRSSSFTAAAGLLLVPWKAPALSPNSATVCV